LSDQICFQYADKNRCINALTVDTSFEQKIIDSKYTSAGDDIAALDPKSQQTWIKAVSKYVSMMKEKGLKPVILCSQQARRLVVSSLDRDFLEVAVLSAPEIAKGFKAGGFDVNVFGNIEPEEETSWQQ
jgi:flagellar biosynthesis component FlhA